MEKYEARGYCEDSQRISKKHILTIMKWNKQLLQILIIFTVLLTFSLVTRQWIQGKFQEKYSLVRSNQLSDHVLIVNSGVNFTSVTHSHTKSTIQPPRSTRSINVLSRNIHTLVDIKHLQRHRFSGFGNGSIPRIVHVTYKSSNIPTQYEVYLRHCLAINPDVAFLFWTDAHAEEFVKQTINENGREEERSLHKKLSTYSGLEKADVFRNMLLYYIGGVYMDLDMECKVSFNVTFIKLAKKMAKKYKSTSYSSQISCMVDQEQWIQTRIRWFRKFCPMNNFMICRPQHPFFRHILSNLKEDDKSGESIQMTPSVMLHFRIRGFQLCIVTTNVATYE
jgi:hypothetical protein